MDRPVYVGRDGQVCIFQLLEIFCWLFAYLLWCISSATGMPSTVMKVTGLVVYQSALDYITFQKGLVLTNLTN